jgi:hypothetical protein
MRHDRKSSLLTKCFPACQKIDEKLMKRGTDSGAHAPSLAVDG